MPGIETHWDSFKRAIEEVFREVSGSGWKVEQLSSLPDLGRAVTLSFGESGAISLAFTDDAYQAVAALVLGQSQAMPSEQQIDEAVTGIMRQAADRLSASLWKSAEIEECRIEVESCQAADGFETAFELKASDHSALRFRVRFGREPARGKMKIAENTEDWSALYDVEIDVKLRFGTRELTLADILELSSGDVVDLEQKLEEPADLLVANRVFARGDVVLIDGHYGLRITELLARRLA